MTADTKNGKWNTLVYGLIYPAILGAMIFAFLDDIQSRDWFQFSAGVLTMLYFCSQFVEGRFSTRGEFRYVVDIFEVLLLYQLMVSLELAPAIWSLPSDFILISRHGKAHFFFTFLFVLALPPASRWFDRVILSGRARKLPDRTALSVIAIAITLMGYFLGDLDIVAAIALFVAYCIWFVYFIAVIRNS